MAQLEQTGVIMQIFPTERIKDNFSKRVIVLKTGKENYPQLVPFEFTQYHCDLLDNFHRGETVTITFELRGREYNGKYYVSVNGWKIVRAGQPPSDAQPPGQVQAPPNPQTVSAAALPEPPASPVNEDLPF